MVSGASIINSEHISNFTDIIVEQINAVWTWETSYSFTQ